MHAHWARADPERGPSTGVPNWLLDWLVRHIRAGPNELYRERFGCLVSGRAPAESKPPPQNRMPEGEQGQDGHSRALLPQMSLNTGNEEAPRMHPQGNRNKARRSQIPVQIFAKRCLTHARMLSVALTGESKGKTRCTRDFSR